MQEFDFEAIGTHWNIRINDILSDAQSEILLAHIRTRIDTFDRDYSRFRADSLVTRMSKEAGIYTLPEDARTMLDVYHALYTLTGGLLTPLIGQVISDAGYDAAYSLKSKTLQKPPSWDDVLDYSYPSLTVKKPALLDFGAAGKGYLVDIVTELLQDKGITSGSVDAGGDMRVFGTQEPLRIGLEHPEDTTKAIGVALIKNRSICGSAGNRRAWGEFHHIISPETLSSVRTVLAVWIVADTALLADALATCLFFVPPQMLLKHYQFEYLTMYKDHSIEHSKEFPAELFVTN